jgi:diguanylate cyclase (GGDEF)-like protein/PAS domain S-box-containing protein
LRAEPRIAALSSPTPAPGSRSPEDELARRRRTEEKLQAAVSQLTATLDSTTDGIAVIGFDNRLLRYNQRFSDLWRIPRERLDEGDTPALLEAAMDQLVDPQSFFAPVQALHADPMGESFDRLQFKDGRVYERFSRPLLGEGRANGRVWSFRDITSRVRAEKMQAALYKISQAAHSARDLDDLFRAIHDIIAELLPAKNFYVALYDPATDLISFPYWVDEVDERPPPRKASERRGLTGLVIQTGEPLLLSPGWTNEITSRPGEGFMGSDGVDWLGIPLKTARGTIGVLTVQNYSGDARYTERDKELLQFVSDQVAAAVEGKLAEQALRESEERFRRVFDQSPIIICLLSYPEGKLLEMNAAGLEAFGYGREELSAEGKLEFNAWVDPDQRLRYHRLLNENGSVQNFEARMRRRDGSVFTVLHSGSLVTLGGQHCSLSSLQDISDRKRAEEWQQHYADMLGQIAAEAPLARVLESLALFAERQSPGIRCAIMLVTPDRKRLLSGVAPSLPPGFNAAIDGMEVSEKGSPCGKAAATGEIVIVEDLRRDPDSGPWLALAEAAGVRSVWSHPVLSATGGLLGTFAIYRREPARPGAEEIELIRRSAGMAAIAIERAQHHEAQRLARVVFEQSLQGLMVTDAAGRVIMVNASFEALTGYSAVEVVGRDPGFLDAGREEAAALESRREALAETGRWTGETCWRRKSGEFYPVAMSVATVNDASGAPSHTISILSDVSEQKIQKARIEQLAFYDSLTGLPNRALFLDRLEHTLASARRNGGRGAILFLDLDRFKEINDSQGHAIGDMALAEVARRLQAAAREGETLARLGGDEFVLIAENADIPTAVRIAARLGRVLSEPLQVSGHVYIVGASIGIAFYPDDGDRSDDLIRRTDIAMYQAKSGGGGYRLYRPEMGEKLEKRLLLAKRLQQALEAGRLQLFYQPQVSLARGEVIGAEALLRWFDADLGWISPGEFIPIAEERGMMVQLGDWVLREACRQVGEWQRAGLQLAGRIAINVSALQMEDPDIVGRLLDIVHEAGLRPDRFELELTESSMMADPERAVEVLELLRAAGFGLSIDDFGTGYSSLSYLKRFAADHIKIDISFVRNMLTDPNDYTIVTTIIAMADSLGLKTTAEGVEEAAQAEALLALHCDSAQGYHFGRPEPPQVFAQRWLEPASGAAPRPIP